MDLGTASDKLRTEKYRFVEEALDDIQLVWDNCKNYNHPDTVRPPLPSGSTSRQRTYSASSRKWSRTTSPAYPSLSPAVKPTSCRNARSGPRGGPPSARQQQPLRVGGERRGSDLPLENALPIKTAPPFPRRPRTAGRCGHPQMPRSLRSSGQRERAAAARQHRPRSVQLAQLVTLWR